MAGSRDRLLNPQIAAGRAAPVSGTLVAPLGAQASCFGDLSSEAIASLSYLK